VGTSCCRARRQVSLLETLAQPSKKACTQQSLLGFQAGKLFFENKTHHDGHAKLFTVGPGTFLALSSVTTVEWN
jgi:hypothetical protein